MRLTERCGRWLARLLRWPLPAPDPDKERVREEQREIEARLRALEIQADPRAWQRGEQWHD